MMLLDGRVNTEALHQPFELMGLHQTSGFRGIAGPGEVTILHALGKKQKTVSFP